VPDPVRDPAGDVRVEVVAQTDVGQLREHNEDNFLVLRLDDGARDAAALRAHVVGPRGTLLAVCDGMGGAAAGEVAAQLAIDTIAEMLLASPPSDDDDLVAVARRLRSAAERANETIFVAARDDVARTGMGTTMTAVLLCGVHAIVAQVGDSRAYLWRAGRLVQLTRDQSLVNHLLDQGQLTAEEAKAFEHSNVILQALGVQPCVDVHLSRAELRAGDRLLVCSDGLAGVSDDAQIAALLGSDGNLEGIASALVDAANAAGGPDNITVIVAALGEGLPAASLGELPRYERWMIDRAAAPTNLEVPPQSTAPSSPPDPIPPVPSTAPTPRARAGGSDGGPVRGLSSVSRSIAARSAAITSVASLGSCSTTRRNCARTGSVCAANCSPNRCNAARAHVRRPLASRMNAVSMASNDRTRSSASMRCARRLGMARSHRRERGTKPTTSVGSSRIGRASRST
jgi:serine/threonine protein phosphatase PrpC